jgi:hypothetical protein
VEGPEVSSGAEEATSEEVVAVGTSVEEEAGVTSEEAEEASVV